MDEFEKIYFCGKPGCSYKSKFKHNVRTHQKSKKHCSEKGFYKCDICYKIFYTELSCQQHFRRNHRTKKLKKMYKEVPEANSEIHELVIANKDDTMREKVELEKRLKDAWKLIHEIMEEHQNEEQKLQRKVAEMEYKIKRKSSVIQYQGSE